MLTTGRMAVTPGDTEDGPPLRGPVTPHQLVVTVTVEASRKALSTLLGKPEWQLFDGPQRLAADGHAYRRRQLARRRRTRR